MNNLMRDMTIISSKVLKNTRQAPQRLKFKFKLLQDAYGAATVIEDFKLWCGDNLTAGHKYPIIEYLKVVDSRLGNVPEEKRANMDDPRIETISSVVYDYAGMLPPKKAVAELLMIYDAEELKAAFIEYAERLEEKEVRGAMRAFWTDGGAGAVILARRRRLGK